MLLCCQEQHAGHDIWPSADRGAPTCPNLLLLLSRACCANNAGVLVLSGPVQQMGKMLHKAIDGCTFELGDNTLGELEGSLHIFEQGTYVLPEPSGSPDTCLGSCACPLLSPLAGMGIIHSKLGPAVVPFDPGCIAACTLSEVPRSLYHAWDPLPLPCMGASSTCAPTLASPGRSQVQP